MSFLKNLFGGKDARYYLDKGNRLRLEGRYAEARTCYDDALEKLGDDGGTLRTELLALQGECGDALAAANLEEAEHCLNAGAVAKALDHLDLARALAGSPELRRRVELMSRRVSSSVPPPEEDGIPEERASCACPGGSCGPGGTVAGPSAGDGDGHLSSAERFELMTASLPADLVRRYRALGARFAEAYLLSHDGDDSTAAGILGSITSSESRDIILYELALIRHRQGEDRECESLLRQALGINERNPLCYLALVDLCVGTGRLDEALSLLDAMIAGDLLSAQAVMTKGDILEHRGEDEQALEQYGALLETPYKKDAATKIIPILERLGRGSEARQIFTRYVKGCC